MLKQNFWLKNCYLAEKTIPFLLFGGWKYFSVNEIRRIKNKKNAKGSPPSASVSVSIFYIAAGTVAIFPALRPTITDSISALVRSEPRAMTEPVFM